MKTINTITRMVRGSGLGLATILIAAFATISPANAQYKPVGDDGIAASPKVRAMLNERKATTTPVSPSSTSMGCRKCMDAWVSRADTNSKGLGAKTHMRQTTKLVAQHLCEGCGTDWALTGTGKAKQAVATHKCSGCGSQNLACCSIKAASDVATTGMLRGFQIAPMK